MKASMFRLKTMIGSWNTRSKSPVGEIDEISKVLQALEETKNIKEGKKSHFVSRMI